jgi:hypothetical protein
VAAVAVEGVQQIVKGADLDDIDAWWARVVEDIIALVAAGWAVARELADVFLTDHAEIEGHQVVPVLATWETGQVDTSLRVTGPVAFKQHIAAGGNPASARVAMGNRLAGSVERLVLNGERDTVNATVDDSAEIVGWRRVSDGDPCAFCAMLVSRGAVYKDARSAGDARFGGTPYHDRDGCTAVPLYEHEDEPAEVADLYQQWLNATKGKSGNDALRAWRNYWEGRDEPAVERTFDERADAAASGASARAEAPLSALRESSLRDPLALRPAESDAIDQYKGAKFGAINDSLRGTGDQPDADVSHLVDAMDQAFARSPLSADVIVHRGIGNPAAVFGDAASVNLAGAEWTELAYVSTSTDRDVIDGFMFGSQRMAMRILVPRGVGGIELSNERFESELLLQRGLRMRVVTDSGPGTDPRTLDVEVLP